MPIAVCAVTSASPIHTHTHTLSLSRSLPLSAGGCAINNHQSTTPIFTLSFLPILSNSCADYLSAINLAAPERQWAFSGSLSLFSFPIFRSFLALGCLWQPCASPLNLSKGLPTLFHPKHPPSTVQRTSPTDVTTSPWHPAAHMFRTHPTSKNLRTLSIGHQSASWKMKLTWPATSSISRP